MRCMAKKMGVVGDRDSVLGFKAAGLDVFAADDPHTASRQINRMAKDYAVVFMTEQLYAQIPETIQRYKAQAYPAIIPIPGSKGTLGIGMANVKKNIEKAVGADITV